MISTFVVGFALHDSQVLEAIVAFGTKEGAFYSTTAGGYA